MGPAARARAEGRPYNVKLERNAMTPLVHDDGTPRSKAHGPYLPVLNPCQVCPARCCRLNVKVSLGDAVHYCRTLGLPFFSGLTLVPSNHLTHAFRVERDPRVNPSEEGWLGTCEIQLRRRADGSCHGLVDIGGFERCSIYEARPSLCRLYPMVWSSDVAKGSPGMILCPVPYGVTAAEEREFVRNIENSIERWETHDDIVAEWHDLSPPEGRTVEAFMMFAIPRAAEAMGVSADGILAHGSANYRLYEAMIKSGVVKPKTPGPTSPKP
jgi:Fe-S-cluster containining protein